MRIICLILAIFTFSSFTPPKEDIKRENDSLLRSVMSLRENNSLRLLDQRIKEHSNQDAKYLLLHAFIHEAERQNDEWYKGEAYFLSAAFFYSLNSDSMRYYMQKAEPLLLKAHRIDNVFKMKSCYFKWKRMYMFLLKDTLQEQLT